MNNQERRHHELKQLEQELLQNEQANIDQLIKIQEEIDELEYDLFIANKPERTWNRAPETTNLHDYKLYAPHLLNQN